MECAADRSNGRSELEDGLDHHVGIGEHGNVAARTGTAASGLVMSARWPRNVIVVNKERAPSSPPCESLPVGREYRSVTTDRLRAGVTLRDLIEREAEGS